MTYEIYRFTADWCNPCKRLKPVYEEIANELSKTATFHTINIDEDEEITKQFNVRGLPTIVGVKDGQEVFRLIGAQEKEDIVNVITTS